MIQIPARFSTKLADRIAAVAAEQSTTASKVIGDAIEQLVVAGDAVTGHDLSPDVHSAGQQRIRVYIPRDLADALDSICRVTKMSRAEVVAVAVHRAFDVSGVDETVGAHTYETLAQDLSAVIVRVARRLRLLRMEASTLTSAQSSVLSTLHREGPLTPAALAACERLTAATITQTVARLVARGMLTRNPHPTDGRRAIIALTPLGDDTAGTVVASEQWLAARLADLDDSELTAVQHAANILSKLVDDDRS